MGYRVLDVSTIEGRRKLVAAGLEAAAIRMNQFDNEPNQAGKEHDERESGQEEIYTALEGAGVSSWTARRSRSSPAGTSWSSRARTRQVVAGPEGLSYLIVGARA